jgi:hypothetical protein
LSLPSRALHAPSAIKHALQGEKGTFRRDVSHNIKTLLNPERRLMISDYHKQKEDTLKYVKQHKKKEDEAVTRLVNQRNQFHKLGHVTKARELDNHIKRVRIEGAAHRHGKRQEYKNTLADIRGKYPYASQED